MGVAVRIATPEDLLGVLNVLDGAALSTDHERIEDRIAAGDAFVAVRDDDPERVLGACVLEGERLVVVAVRRRRRDQGIGRALIAAAADDRVRLLVECDPDVAPFYEAVGFDLRRLPEGRLVGVLDPADLDGR